MSFDPLGGAVAAIAERTQPRTITAAELYELAGKSWVPATVADALVRAARTIAVLQGDKHD